MGAIPWWLMGFMQHHRLHRNDVIVRGVRANVRANMYPTFKAMLGLDEALVLTLHVGDAGPNRHVEVTCTNMAGDELALVDAELDEPVRNMWSLIRTAIESEDALITTMLPDGRMISDGNLLLAIALEASGGDSAEIVSLEHRRGESAEEVVDVGSLPEFMEASENTKKDIAKANVHSMLRSVTEGRYGQHSTADANYGFAVCIAAGLDVSCCDRTGHTCLHFPAKDGNEQVLEPLVQARADLESKNSSMGRTALHFAAINGHAEATSELLRLGANPNMRGRDGLTPLALAEHGKMEQEADRYKAKRPYDQVINNLGGDKA